MALNINDPKQVREFRNQQIQLGRSAGEIDSWIRNRVQEEVGRGNTSALSVLDYQTTPAPAKISDQGILGNLGRSIAEPFINTVNKTGGVGFEAYRALASKGGKNPDPYYDPKTGRYIENPFMTQEEIGRASTGAGFVDSLKDAAAIGAFAIPGAKVAKGASALEKILMPTLSEVPRGALLGFSNKEATPESVLASAGIGGGIGMAAGALPVALQAILGKVGKKAVQTGENLSEGVFVKRYGRPTAREGGASFIEDFKSIKEFKGTRGNEELLKNAETILKNDGKIVDKTTQELANKGITINRKSLNDLLDNLYKEAPSARKSVIQTVKKEVVSDFKRNNIDANVFYKMKQKYGDLSGFKFGDSSDMKTKADVYKQLYFKMNGMLDKTLKDGGFDKFRAVNKRVHIAGNTAKFADRQLEKVGTGTNFKLTDMVAGGVGAGAFGNPLGAVGAIAGKKVVESPKAMDFLSNLLKKGGAGASQLSIPQVNPALSKLLNIGSNLSIDQSGQLNNQPQQDYSQIQTNQISQPNDGQSDQLSKLINTLKIMDPSHAAVYDSLIGGGGNKLPASQTSTLADIKTSSNLMSNLKGEIESGTYNGLIGPMKGTVRSANPYDSEAKGFEAKMVQFAQIVGKAMEGGVLRQEDVVKYRKILPQINDTKDTALIKINNVINMLNDQRSNQIVGFQDAGYNTGQQI